MARVGILTLNEHEYAAAKDALTEQGDYKAQAEQKRSVGLVVYTVCELSNGVHDVRMVWAEISGNLTTALIANAEFTSSGCVIWILFGCAGAIPLDDPKYPRVGEVVLVTSAMYAENGLVQISPAGTPRSTPVILREETLIKSARLERMTLQLASGRTKSVRDRLPLRPVAAFCSDKKIRLDVDVVLPPPNSAAFVPYADCLIEFGAQIVDMESYGFFAAAGDALNARCISIRVLTDYLFDQEDSARGHEAQAEGGLSQDRASEHDTAEPGSAPAAHPHKRKQEQLLEDNAHWLLKVLDVFLEDGSAVPRRRPTDPGGDPLPDLQGVTSATASTSFVQSLNYAGRAYEVSATWQAVLASGSVNDQRHARELGRFLRLGYGTQRLSFELQARYKLTGEASLVREDPPSELLAREFMRYIDPTDRPYKYASDLARAVNFRYGKGVLRLIRAADYLAVVTNHEEQIALLVLARPRADVQAGYTHDQRPVVHNEVVWQGFDDDERLFHALDAINLP